MSVSASPPVASPVSVVPITTNRTMAATTRAARAITKNPLPLERRFTGAVGGRRSGRRSGASMAVASLCWSGAGEAPCIIAVASAL